MFVGRLLAERGVLVVNVQDTQGSPMAGVEIGAKGDGGSAVTGKDGKARVPLAAGTKEKSHVDLQIIRPKNLVFIEPWENPVQVPSFDNESANYVRVVLAERGHRKLLEDPDALRAMIQQINKANSVKSRDPGAEEAQRKQSLERVAASFELAPEEVDKAVRAWGEKAKDPYDQGMAALYEKNYRKASDDLAESLKKREENEAKAEEAVVDAAFFLGGALYEQGKYRE
jgi:phenylpropionate dioxygenase-like ring-hydroxylating dioxygenase large terminal subunit